jgi:FixJ family two-component response regulator
MDNAFESKPKIFVVDDEIEIAQMLTVVLQMNLFNAIPFTDPQKVVDAAKAESPDYLISDISMPGMNGIELAILMAQEMPACKVLLFSGHVDAAKLIAEAKEKGYTFNLVEKPIHPTKLVEAIQAL